MSPDAKSVIAHIDKQYRVRYSVSEITDLLHRLGFSYKKPTHVPGRQDPGQQRAFLKEYERIKASMYKLFSKTEEIFAGIANAVDRKLSHSDRLKTGKLNRVQYNCIVLD